jgi:chromosome segregation ATPase
MLKRLINIIWTYSLQDYWNAIWSKTSVDEKAIATVKEVKKRFKLTATELADVGRAIKEVGNQLGDIDDAIKGKARKGRKKR